MFTFGPYELKKEDGYIIYHYELAHNGEVFSFSPKVQFDAQKVDWNKVNNDVLKSVLDTICLNLGITYWKLTCDKEIKLTDIKLNKEQADFWNTVYSIGLGEFYYINQIDFRDLVQFPFIESVKVEPLQTGFDPVKVRPLQEKKSLVLWGGGKDSIVTAEMWKEQGKDFDLFAMNQIPIQQETAQICGHKMIHISREIDPLLFELNKRPEFYNGHIPVSLSFATTSLLAGVLYGYDELVVSNEQSANYGNVEYLGYKINHQWSKSEEFEKLFDNYIKKFITPNINYYSVLRQYDELQIAEMFSKYPQYFYAFSSCNTNFKIGKIPTPKWCCNCAKCAFAFIILSPFIPKNELVKIFGEDLLNKESLKQTYLELRGISGHKPFDCVGTPEEVQKAFELTHKNFSTKVYILGIGGIGISAVARLLQHNGVNVSGSDTSPSPVTEELHKLGIKILIGQDINDIPKDTDLIIYSLALLEYHPELMDQIKELAQNINATIASYPEMLNTISKNKYTIAVSGSHGKTTTTAMIGTTAQSSGIDPTVIVGSLLTQNTNAKSNLIVGNSKYFIAEACEYKRSFLNLSPNILAITNIEADHLDYYKDIDDVVSAFCELAQKIPADGYLVCNPNLPHMQRVIQNAKCKIIDYSQEKIDGILKVPGVYNIENAKCASAVLKLLDIRQDDIVKGLESFTGTWRRFEYKGERDGIKVYDDYAHHPTEITSMLTAMREMYPDNRIIAIFHPHLYSRTKALFKDFAESFGKADMAIFAPIYAAREVDDGTMSSDILAQAVEANGTPAHSLHSFADIVEFLKQNTKSGDIVVTIGAGDIYHAGEQFLSS